MGWITRVLVVICLLWICLSGSLGLKRKLLGPDSCGFQPNQYFPPACIYLAKFKDPESGGSFDFLGTAVMMEYDATADLSKAVTASSLQSIVSLKVNPLTYKGKPLFGWFHVKLESTSDSFPLTWVFAQGETVYTEAAPAGSFVPLNTDNWGKSCRSEQVARNTSIPCYYTQEPFPLTPYAFGRYDPSRKVYTYSLFFRLDSPLCDVLNSQNGIYFRAYIMNDATKGKLPAFPKQELIFVEDKFYGGPDPAPPSHVNNVDCSGDITSAEWVKSVGPEYSISDAIPYDTCIDNICYFENSYEGRCAVNRTAYNYNDTDWWVHPGYTHYCYTVKPSRNESNWPELETYIRTVENYTQSCPNCTVTMNFLKETGIPVKSAIGEYIWGSRQAHSVFMVVAVLFLYPVSAFIARYYKETYMRERLLVNLHVWYSVHTYLNILVVIALINGLILAIFGRKFYGYSLSKAGKTHVIVGYLTLFCALIGVATSAIRLRTPFLRSISVFAHFVSGTLFYLCSIVSIISSMFVPGSPSGADDVPPGWKNKKGALPKIEARFPYMILLLLLWICFDAVIHVVSSLKLKLSDWRARRKIFPRRKWILNSVPIPLRWQDDTQDFNGSGFRKLLLLIYVTGSGITAVSFVLWLSFVPNENRNLGQMRYTHGGKFEGIFDLFDDGGNTNAVDN